MPIRAIVEFTISSLKRITGIKPIRAWNEDSVGGSMVVALLAEAAMSMARYCLSKSYKRIDTRSGWKKKSYVPSTKTMNMELGYLTLTRFKNKMNVLDGNLSNWTPLTIGVFEDIKAHECPDWGSKKVPSSCRGVFSPIKCLLCRMPTHINRAQAMHFLYACATRERV